MRWFSVNIHTKFGYIAYSIFCYRKSFLNQPTLPNLHKLHDLVVTECKIVCIQNYHLVTCIMVDMATWQDNKMKISNCSKDFVRNIIVILVKCLKMVCQNDTNLSKWWISFKISHVSWIMITFNKKIQLLNQHD